MHRQMIYVGQIPEDTDQLLQSKNTMIGLGYALQAILGTSTLVDGLACTPTSPAGMTVNVAGGSIYAQEEIDATAFGSVPADTTDLIVKQGIIIPTTNFSCPAPATSGQSVVYLVEAIYQDIDGGSTTLPYYNASNPAIPYSGPNNTGVSQNTVRQGVCTLTLKTGVAATTGSQVTPSPDAGYTGLWAITVANGQTTITSPNIAQVSGAPFIGTKLTSLAPLASPALTGAPTAPTPAAGDSSTKLATTAFARNAATAYAVSVFTSSGTFTTPATSSASTVYRYRIISGGGGAGGANAAGTACGGGGAGAEAIGTFTGVAASTGITITIGAGGSAGSASGTNGGNGGSSSIGSPVSITCSGGGFGTGSTTANTGTFGGNGGAVTVGTPSIAAITGQRGANGLGVSTAVMLAGNGGSTSLGAAGIGGCINVVGNGGLSTGYGSGGGGGISTGNGGSAGQAGIIVIEQMTP